MKATVVVLGVFAALFAGLAVLFTLGEVPAFLAFALILGLAIYGLFAPRRIVKVLLGGVTVVLIASAAFVGVGGGGTSTFLGFGLRIMGPHVVLSS